MTRESPDASGLAAARLPCSHMLRDAPGGCPTCASERRSPTRSPSIDRIRRARAARSFRAFVEIVWPAIEPTRALMPSVAIDAMCAALQAVAEGRIRRLGIVTCPGTSKSLVAAVAFPAWLLLRNGGRERIMVGSYSWDFAERDSRRCRDLITRGVYRVLVGDAWCIRDDADKRSDYWTTAGGRRLIVSPSGKALGERCTIQIIDDALSGADVHSPAAKKEARDWINTVLPSRLEDPEHNARVLVGQRLSVDDPLSVAIDQGWKMLVLPALLAETDEPCELLDDHGDLVWRDPRKPGQPIVSLLGHDALDRLRDELGSGPFAAQYLARPQSDATATIRRAWWKFYRDGSTGARRPSGCTDAAAIDKPERWDAVAIAADLTFGSAKGDYAVVQAWGASGGRRFLLRQFRERCGFERQVAAIKEFARAWPTAKIVVEKAANGAAVIETLQKQIPNVCPEVPRGSKAQRMASIAPTVESGSCFLPDTGEAWVAELVEELAGATKHDDAADAAAYAILALAANTSEPSVQEKWIMLGTDGSAGDQLRLAKLRQARGAEITPHQENLIAREKIQKLRDEDIVLGRVRAWIEQTEKVHATRGKPSIRCDRFGIKLDLIRKWPAEWRSAWARRDIIDAAVAAHNAKNEKLPHATIRAIAWEPEEPR